LALLCFRLPTFDWPTNSTLATFLPPSRHTHRHTDTHTLTYKHAQGEQVSLALVFPTTHMHTHTLTHTHAHTTHLPVFTALHLIGQYMVHTHDTHETHHICTHPHIRHTHTHTHTHTAHDTHDSFLGSSVHLVCCVRAFLVHLPAL